MARIERGDPSVAMASYVMCMWLVNPAMAVADVIAPQNDHAALEREVTRVRGSRKTVKDALHPDPSTATTVPSPSRSRPAAAVGLAALIQPRSAKAQR